MLDNIFQKIAYKNYHFKSIPPITMDLLLEASRLLQEEFHMSLMQNGSFNSKTTVAKISDIDLLAIFDFGYYEDNQKFFRDMSLSTAALLTERLRAIDVDVEYDLPAVCLTHLSEPDYRIEITPAVSASAFGAHLPSEEDDYFILDSLTNIVSTNPLIHTRVTEYLNSKTSNTFAYLCSLLKLWKYHLGLPLTSFAIEIFVYHWMRGTCDEGNFPVMEAIHGEINLDFSCKNIPINLEIGILDILKELLFQLSSCQEQNRLYQLTNPFIHMRIPNTLFSLFHSMEDQWVGIDAIKDSINLLAYAIEQVRRNESNGDEAVYALFGLEAI